MAAGIYQIFIKTTEDNMNCALNDNADYLHTVKMQWKKSRLLKIFFLCCFNVF